MSIKSDAAKAEIIEAARKVLSQIGVKNMTLQSVADAASISKGALYHYYKTKDNILYDIMEQDNAHSREINKRLDENLDIDEAKREITKGILERFEYLDKNKLNLYIQGEALQGNKELQKRYNEKYHEWIKNMDETLSRIYNVDSSDITRTISTIALAAIEGICIQKALMDRIEGREELIAKIIIFILNLDYNVISDALKETPGLE